MEWEPQEMRLGGSWCGRKDWGCHPAIASSEAGYPASFIWESCRGLRLGIYKSIIPRPASHNNTSHLHSYTPIPFVPSQPELSPPFGTQFRHAIDQGLTLPPLRAKPAETSPQSRSARNDISASAYCYHGRHRSRPEDKDDQVVLDEICKIVIISSYTRTMGFSYSQEISHIHEYDKFIAEVSKKR
jgi:hypothetical protein